MDARETPVDGGHRSQSDGDGDVSFPWRAGESVAPPWRVRSVRFGRPLVVVLERAAGEWVELGLAAEPGRAAFGAFGLDGVAVTHRSRLPTPTFAAAARIVLDRISERSGGDPARFVARFVVSQAVNVELPPSGTRRDATETVAVLRARLDALDDAAHASVALHAQSADGDVVPLLQHCLERGVAEVCLTLSGASSLRPASLRRLAPFQPILTVELVLDSLPAPAPRGPREWAFEQLGSSLAVLRRAGIPTRSMLELDQGSAGELVQITRVAALVATQDAGPLDVSFIDPARAERLGRRAPSASSLRALLETAANARHLLVVHAPDASAAPAPESEEPAQPLRIDWHDQVRLLLVDRPGVRITLGDVLPPDELSPWKCSLPWKRLETNSAGAYGPCCADYRQLRWIAAPGATPEALWNGEHMRAMRRAMATDGHPSTCLESCPVLAAGLEAPGKTRLVGGSAALVESQIQLVEDMLAGREEARTPPMQVCIATTSHCNYDCLMCIADRNGPEDELAPEVYAGLAPWLDRLLVLDANGGEPLASPSFRAFLDHTDFARYPGLGVHLTTNGSYLTPAQLDRYDRIPFSSLTISLNAATAETYLAVNRGLPWARARENLDALLRAAAEGRMSCHIRYGMVVLRANLHEVEAFAELAARDGVGVRYLLPVGDRHGQSTLTDEPTLRRARDTLSAVRVRLDAGGLRGDAAELEGLVRVLDQRLSAGILRPL